jgi:hypothetical protein
MENDSSFHGNMMWHLRAFSETSHCFVFQFCDVAEVAYHLSDSLAKIWP